MSRTSIPLAEPAASTDSGSARRKSWYEIVSLSLSAVFVVVGLLFLCIPHQVISLFNHLSRPLGMVPAPVESAGFFVILAVAYMYLVALLALLMYLHPDDKTYSLLLINGKAASSLLSLLLFVFSSPYLILLTNFLVDGAIAGLVFSLRSVQKRSSE